MQTIAPLKKTADPASDGVGKIPPTAAGVRLWPALLAAALVALIVAALPLTDVGDSLERRTFDLRFALRGPRPTRARVVIAALDAKSEQAWSEEPTLFWTAHYADIIRQSLRNGARVIGFDVIPEVSGQRYIEGLGVPKRFQPDALFGEAIMDAGEGTTVFAERVEAPSPTGASLLGESVSVTPASFFLDIPEVHDYLGFADQPSSPDDVNREAFYCRPGEDVGDSLPAFAALVARQARGGGDLPGAPTPTAADPVPSFYVNFTERKMPTISAVDLAKGTLTPAERQLLQGAAVLVGATTADSVDWHLGPGGKIYSGVALQAEAVVTLLDGCPLRRLSRWGEAGITLIFGLISAGAVILGIRSGKAMDRPLAALVALYGMLLGAALILFTEGNFLLPISAPLLAVIGPWVAARAVASIEERRIRNEISAQFGRYVSPRIQAYLMAHPEHARLGGVEQKISVLFLDIRRSTKYASKRAPLDVLNDLNNFFGKIVNIIDEHNGLLCRYTGDGFLAIFGAPETSETHAGDAVRCAVALARAVSAVNIERDSAGLMPLEIGCAINTGQTACGNMGVEGRLEYTVIGDTVNVAAKIEGLNKNPKGDVYSHIVMTGATLALTEPESLSGLVPLRQKQHDIYLSPETGELSFFHLGAVDQDTTDEPSFQNEPEETTK